MLVKSPQSTKQPHGGRQYQQPLLLTLLLSSDNFQLKEVGSREEKAVLSTLIWAKIKI